MGYTNPTLVNLDLRSCSGLSHPFPDIPARDAQIRGGVKRKQNSSLLGRPGKRKDFYLVQLLRKGLREGRLSPSTTA